MGGGASGDSCPKDEDLAVDHDNRRIVPSISCDGARLWISYQDVPMNYNIIWRSIRLPSNVVGDYQGISLNDLSRPNDNIIRCKRCDGQACTYYFEKAVRLANLRLLLDKDIAKVPRNCTACDERFVAESPPPPRVICPCCTSGTRA
jgi:hypothetical protein